MCTYCAYNNSINNILVIVIAVAALTMDIMGKQNLKKNNPCDKYRVFHQNTYCAYNNSIKNILVIVIAVAALKMDMMGKLNLKKNNRCNEYRVFHQNIKIIQ